MKRAKNTINKVFLYFKVKFEVFSKDGSKTLWLNLLTHFSVINIIGGRTTTVDTNPKSTPLLITRPISLPRPSLIKSKTKNPAKVVNEDAKIDATVLVIAFDIASLLSSFDCFFSAYLWYKNIE